MADFVPPNGAPIPGPINGGGSVDAGGGFSGSFYNGNYQNPFVNNRPVYITPTQACQPVYSNQSTIDSLNSILANMETLKTSSNVDCSDKFIATIENELMKQIAMGVIIGQNCNNNFVLSGTTKNT